MFTPRVSIPQNEVYSWQSQAQQYPRLGKPGIHYFAGETNLGTVHCLLCRDGVGRLAGILNYYDQDFGTMERAGNVNLWVHPAYQRQGVATHLWLEAQRLWNVTFVGQRFTRQGAAFAKAFMARQEREMADR